MKKIDRRAALELYKAFPLRTYDPIKDSEECYFPNSFTDEVLTTDAKEGENSAEIVIRELMALLGQMEFSTFIFMGDTDQPWLRNTDNNPNLIEMQNFLSDNGIDKKFNGAVIIDLHNLPALLNHLFTLTKCNAAMPYIFFTDEKQNLLMNICHYDNLHINALNERTAEKWSSFFQIPILESCRISDVKSFQ